MNFNGPSCMPFSGIQLEFRTQEGIGYFLAWRVGLNLEGK
jgi:hypothetical protein